MKKLEGKTLDLVAKNVGKLQELFPDAFTEGKVDFDVLKEMLGTFVDDRDERYTFTWNGKKNARKIAYENSIGTLRPCKEESVDWDSTQNIFIEGDNLEVLKLLQKSYHKKVKMIYIDPPYNTGKDFVYKDNFKNNIKNYKEITGQIDDEGRNLSNNPETSGRYHTDWLNMMYPRLKLARNLLKDDGVIFISIDDSEYSNLKKMSDEIFGEENFIATSIWERAFSPVNLMKHFSQSHDYIVCYAKSIERAICNGLKRKEEVPEGYKNPDNDQRGPWTSGDLSVGPVIQEKIYEITTPSGKKVLPPSGYCWRFSKERFEELISDNRIWFGKEGTNVPRIKRFLSEVKETVTPMTIWKHADVGHSQDAKQKLKELFDGKAYFDYPKPVGLVERCLELYSDDESIILDFFAGSSATAHAVMQLNTKDDCNRKFIMIQLPEATDENSEAFKAGYISIAEISKERIRRAAAKIKVENPISNGDLGFKVFKLDSTNLKPWDVDADSLNDEFLNKMVGNIKEGRREEDVLYEILLKYGLDLTLPITEHDIAGQKVFDIGMGALVICLSDDISLEVVEGIAKLKDELNPEFMRVVFKDSGFKDDVVKTNAVQILKQAGIVDVRSL